MHNVQTFRSANHHCQNHVSTSVHQLGSFPNASEKLQYLLVLIIACGFCPLIALLRFFSLVTDTAEKKVAEDFRARYKTTHLKGKKAMLKSKILFHML